MSSAERAQFLPIVRSFTDVLENNNSDPNKTNQLLLQVREIAKMIPSSLRNNIPAIQGMDLSQFAPSLQGSQNIRPPREPVAAPQSGNKA